MGSNKNILILSAGRRVKLVEAFKSAISTHLPEAQVLTTDMFPELSSACYKADGAIEAPRVTDPQYIDFLKEVCVSHQVGLLVPTIDTELLLLSQVRPDFEDAGFSIAVSSPELVVACRDKRKTAELFDKLDIDQPQIYNRTQICFPCFCKPYDGSCSQGAYALYSENMLTQELLENQKNIFMELVGKEFCEYTVDVYYDKYGKLCCLVPRERIEVRAGEVSKGGTRRNKVYDYLRPRLEKMQGARGCITAQFFFNPATGEVKGLEINPRFGGGYPLSFFAGANFPEWMIREYLLDEELGFFDEWQENLLMLRYDEHVIVNDPNN